MLLSALYNKSNWDIINTTVCLYLTVHIFEKPDDFTSQIKWLKYFLERLKNLFYSSFLIGFRNLDFSLFFFNKKKNPKIDVEKPKSKAGMDRND